MDLPYNADIHDMRTCLDLGFTPSQPIYTKDEDVAICEKVDNMFKSHKEKIIASGLFFHDKTESRRVHVSFERTIFIIISLIKMSGHLRLIPIEQLQTSLPNWEWKYHRKTDDSLLSANYVFSFDGGSWISASTHDCGHRFLCMLENDWFDDSHEGFLTERGFSLLKISESLLSEV
ncbi:MAG: hypothetical protein WC087_03920 [Candidatus Paceibacterota bacterium]